jgi:hypothetical protein
MPTLYSKPAILAVGFIDAGGLSEVSHHGAWGNARTLGSTNGTPPAAAVIVVRNSHTCSAIAWSPPTSLSMLRPTSQSTGWLSGQRLSGSRALPNPPSAF